MRRLHDEHLGTAACNDADSGPTLRTGVRGIYLTAPLDAQAGTEVQIGLLPRLQPHFAGALYGDAVEVLARSTRHPRQAGHSLEFIPICGRNAHGSSTWRTRSATSVGC